MMHWVFVAVLIMLVATAASGDQKTTAQTMSYRVTDLGAIPQGGIEGCDVALNNRGEAVVSISYGGEEQRDTAYLWRAGRRTRLRGLPDYPHMTICRIDDQGRIVGNV